jgi:hypothetical protein
MEEGGVGQPSTTVCATTSVALQATIETAWRRMETVPSVVAMVEVSPKTQTVQVHTVSDEITCPFCPPVHPTPLAALPSSALLGQATASHLLRPNPMQLLYVTATAVLH